MHKLAANIYFETTSTGLNVGAIVTKEGIICIDTPAHLAEVQKWRQKLAELSDKRILFVINTDHHRDRVLGNQWFEAPVVAHDHVSERVRQYPELIRSGLIEGRSEFEPRRDQLGTRIVPPHISFSNELTLLKGDHEVLLRHVGGASAGAIWVIVPKANIVFTGDTVVTVGHPFVGEADVPQWSENLAQLAQAKFKTMIPGRGKVAEAASLRFMNRYLAALQKKMTTLLKQRKTSRAMVSELAQELVKQFPVPETQREGLTRRLRAELEQIYDARFSAK